jgi:signal transduction histidine kinase
MDRHHSDFPPTTYPVREPGGEPSASDLADVLERSHADIEQEKVALVRMLHDDLGGLLVGAIMDIGWISQQPGHSEPVREKLARATGLLRAAIDLKRELIESLRPTLLDNVGLFSTLRWHLKATCDAAGVSYSENFPPSEVSFSSDLKIAVFRICQRALKHVLCAGTARELSLDVAVVDQMLHVHLKSVFFDACAQGHERVSPETSMRHRVQRMGGTLEWLQAGAANHLHLQIPFTAPAG